MKNIKLILIIFFLSQQIFAQERSVLVISLDGVGYNFLKNKNLSSFNTIKKNGLHGKMNPVFQSTTFPAHASMATGVYPNKHGIIHNIFYDEVRGKFNYSGDTNWYDVPPIWITAEQNGIKSAVYFWIGSDTNWKGVSPSFKKVPFNNKVSEEIKINQILNWIDLPVGEKPRLIMSWWHGIDSQGHKFGTRDQRTIEQLNKQNKNLLELINQLDKRNAWEYLTLFIVSDHGMTDISNFINLKSTLETAGIDASVYDGPAVAHIFLNSEDIDRAKEVLSNIQEIEIYKKNETPSNLHLDHPSRSGDIIVTTNAPNMFLSNSKVKNILATLLGPKGMHGYKPLDPNMTAIFFAMGKGVENLDSEITINQVDLAPTIADILNITLPYEVDGNSIQNIK